MRSPVMQRLSEQCFITDYYGRHGSVAMHRHHGGAAAVAVKACNWHTLPSSRGRGTKMHLNGPLGCLAFHKCTASSAEGASQNTSLKGSRSQVVKIVSKGYNSVLISE